MFLYQILVAKVVIKRLLARCGLDPCHLCLQSIRITFQPAFELIFECDTVKFLALQNKDALYSMLKSKETNEGKK